MCWDTCRQEGGVKIWFGLRPEQSICLDVIYKRDLSLLSLSVTKSLHSPAVVYHTIVLTHTGNLGCG